MKLKIISIIFLLFMFGSAGASEGVSVGKIKNLSYRLGDVLFQVVDGSTNHCGQCGPDISGYSSGRFCWVGKDNKNLISMVLTAYSSGKTVSGRVSSWGECSLYQFRIND